MGSMGEASVGAGGFGHRGLLGLRGRSLLPLALLCLVFGAGGHQQPPGEVQDEVGFEGFDEVGDYEEYEDEYVTEGEEVEEDWVDYEYVDLQKDSDGTDSGITSMTLMMTMTVYPTSKMMMMTGMG